MEDRDNTTRRVGHALQPVSPIIVAPSFSASNFPHTSVLADGKLRVTGDNDDSGGGCAVLVPSLLLPSRPPHFCAWQIRYLLLLVGGVCRSIPTLPCRQDAVHRAGLPTDAFGLCPRLSGDHGMSRLRFVPLPEHTHLYELTALCVVGW